ncbi:MAG: ECF transporter S component [Lachnospiraceae bacterium]|nr:ECF transporter S component [Lachnospiraceae bacterium]
MIPAILVATVFTVSNGWYLPLSLLVLALVMAPFFMVFERRRPKAREVVLIAMMCALTVVIHMFFHIILPVQVGTAMVIIAGISLGPEAGFLIGALSRFVVNFFMGQGMWTPWQMFCWGLLGFLAGLAFNLNEEDHLKSTTFKVIMGPLLAVVFAEILAYVSYLIVPGNDPGFPFWRLYVFGAFGLLAGVLLQRKRLPADGLSLALFTFFTTFIIYGGLMNCAAMVTGAIYPGSDGISLSALRAVYISGAPYDLLHASTAALSVFLLGEPMIKKLERVKIKYGIYKR